MKKRISTTLKIGALSGLSIQDFYYVCRRFNVEVISCNKISGFFVKTYHVTVEGQEMDIAKVAMILEN